MRGVVGDTMTPTLALSVGQSLASWIRQGCVVVGGDTRTSHDTLKGALVSGILACGVSVIDIGRVTTPTLQQSILRHQASLGVMITASHNPAIWNGLKIMNHEGSFLTHSEYEAFMACYHAQNWHMAAWDQQGSYHHDPHAIEEHVALVLDRIDTSPIRNGRPLSVLVDANHGAGAVADPVLFRELGVSHTLLNAEPTGRFAHDPEPLEKNLGHIKSVMAGGGYDIGFVQDADADRLVILDETGRFIGEDYSLAFCIDHVLQMATRDDQSPPPHVVVNLSTSQVVADVVARHGGVITHTKVGEAHVTEGLRNTKALVGGEGNGGVIYPKIGWGRDSLVGMVLALRHCAVSGRSVSEIVNEYPAYTMLRHRLALDSHEQVATVLQGVRNAFPNRPTICEDGVKVLLPDGWLHARASNTEPIIRIFVEAPHADIAHGYLKQVIE